MEKHAPASPSGDTYVAWLLRVWRDGDDGVWHASLQAIDGRPPLGFADLEHLFAFLSELTDAGAESRRRPASVM